jgi:hypothetical protein
MCIHTSLLLTQPLQHPCLLPALATQSFWAFVLPQTLYCDSEMEVATPHPTCRHLNLFSVLFTRRWHRRSFRQAALQTTALLWTIESLSDGTDTLESDLFQPHPVNGIWPIIREPVHGDGAVRASGIKTLILGPRLGGYADLQQSDSPIRHILGWQWTLQIWFWTTITIPLTYQYLQH